MHRRLFFFGFFLCAVVFLVGLGNAQVPGNPKVVAEPLILEPGKQGGTLKALGGRPGSLNPYVDDDMAGLVHAVLLELNPITYGIESGVAESFEWASDGMALTLTLRNIRFSDGTPLTPEDVLFTLNDVLLNPELQTDGLNGLRRFISFGEGQFIIKNAEKLDARRVRVHLNTLAGTLTRLLANIPILPRHKLAHTVKKLNPNATPDAFAKAWGLDTKPEDVVGLGPFKFKTANAKQIIFERNPLYWKVDKNRVQLPYAHAVELNFLVDPKDLPARIQAGDADGFSISVDFVNIKIRDAQTLFSAAEKAGMKFAYRGLGMQNTMLSVNQDAADETLRNLFRDLRFRRALAHLMDRERMVKETLSGFAVVRDTFISPASPLFERQANARFDFNLERAKSLLDEIGLKDANRDGVRELPNGKPLQIELLINEANEARVNVAKLLTESFAAAGIKLVTLARPGTDVSQRINKRPPEYQLLLISIVGSAISPEDFFTVFHSTGPNHFYKPSDATGKDVPDYQKRVDEILMQLFVERDEAKRRALAIEFQKLTSENLPVIWLFSPGFYLAVKPNIGNAAALTTIDAAASLAAFETLWLK